MTSFAIFIPGDTTKSTIIKTGTYRPVKANKPRFIPVR